MVFRDDDRGTYMQLDTVKELDYYFLHGPTLDDVVANYRTLTGRAPMLPTGIVDAPQTEHATVWRLVGRMVETTVRVGNVLGHTRLCGDWPSQECLASDSGIVSCV